MKKIALILVLQCSVLAVAAQVGSKAERNKIKMTIDSLNKEMERVFNANDMAGTAAFYSDDAEIVAPDYLVSGRINLDNYWMALKGLGLGWKLEVVEIGGTGDYIYQLGKSDLTYLVNGKSTKAITNFVLLWKKQEDGNYKIFRDYLTDTEFKKPK
jgi:ketosteroid isomerase-like protein